MSFKGLTMTDMEVAVMNKLLDGDHAILSELRTQFKIAHVVKREMTGVGFYLTFSVPESLPGISQQGLDFSFGDVHAEIENFASQVGFILWISKGKLDMLEGYSYSEGWPTKIDSFQLKYIGSSRILPFDQE